MFVTLASDVAREDRALDLRDAVEQYLEGKVELVIAEGDVREANCIENVHLAVKKARSSLIARTIEVPLSTEERVEGAKKSPARVTKCFLGLSRATESATNWANRPRLSRA